MQIANKTVLMRVDFNVPVQDGIVQDDARIKIPLDTVKSLQKLGNKIVLMSHLGKTCMPCESQSLKQVIPNVEEIYQTPVLFIDDCLSDKAPEIIKEAPKDCLILLENLRFHPEEEKCDLEFAKKLASLGDVYVNEAFSASHRAHASLVGVPRFLPSALGLSLKKEVQIVDDFFSKDVPVKMCLVGGAKLETKVKLLQRLVQKVDKLALGGGIAAAFLADLNTAALMPFIPIGYEKEVEIIKQCAKDYNCELILPTDFSALIFSESAFEPAIISSDAQQANIFDIGVESVKLFSEHIRKSNAFLWNGPVGLFERSPFDYGTRTLATVVAEQTTAGKLISILGGGDTCYAMSMFNLQDRFTHLSTAGGAFLQYIEGTDLPGITAIQEFQSDIIIHKF